MATDTYDNFEEDGAAEPDVASFVESRIDKKEVAKRLGVGLATVTRWMREGRISYYRIGSRIWFSPKHIAEFLAASEVKRSA